MSFKAEQKVKYSGMEMPATVISGPHPTHGADRWLIRKADGKVSLVAGAKLEAIAEPREAVARIIVNHMASFSWDASGHSTRAKGLRAADAILAKLEELPKASPEAPLAAGDKIRILRRGLQGARVEVGDVLTVLNPNYESISGRPGIRTDAPRSTSGMTWTFHNSELGTGWERA
jgi:hypothetical protein